MQSFYIKSNQDLQGVIDLAYSKKIIAVDTEFTREKTYYPILSLVQIAVDNNIFLIDCFENIDLKALYNVIASKEIKKIFHSSAQDLQIFYQQSEMVPNNVIDLQIMANFCGFSFNVGYSALVEKLFSVAIDKKMQCSDWQQRPLHEDQIKYAAIDVVYLEEIYRKLSQELTEKKREKWFLEDSENFVNKVLYRDENALFKNFSMQKKFGRKTKTQLEQIKNLVLWREKMAQKINVPRRHFLEDIAIEEIVMLEKFHKKLDDEMCDEILQIIRQCDIQEIIEEQNSYRNIMNEKQKTQFKRAKNLIAKISTNENLCEQFLITNSDLKNFILGNKSLKDVASGWRYFLFGRDLQKII